MLKIPKSSRRKGGTTIVMLGVTGAIVLFCLFFLELQTFYDYQYAIEVRAQRAINSCVEYSMNDQRRSDGFNEMNVTTARNSYKSFLNDDLKVNSNGQCYGDSGKVLYTVSYGTPTFYDGKGSHGAGMSIKITVNMRSGLGRVFGFGGYKWSQTFESTNFRTDNNERSGRK